jgi:hypothetical protein
LSGYINLLQDFTPLRPQNEIRTQRPTRILKSSNPDLTAETPFCIDFDRKRRALRV